VPSERHRKNDIAALTSPPARPRSVIDPPCRRSYSDGAECAWESVERKAYGSQAARAGEISGEEICPEASGAKAVQRAGSAERRTTFLIGRDGRIAKVWPRVTVDGHAAEVLAAAKAL
jgi:hypothetical protein